MTSSQRGGIGSAPGSLLPDLRAGWVPALLIGVAAAFLFSGYEFVRSTAMNLFLEAYGSKSLPMITALVPIGVFLSLYGYGRLLSWLGPRKTLLATNAISGVTLILCYAAIRQGWAQATGVLFIVRETYIMLVVEQYWSFLNSTLGTQQAKVLNGPICGVGSLGSILGGWGIQWLSVPLGTETMVLFCAGLLVPTAFFSDWAYRFSGEPVDDKKDAQVPHGHMGLGLFRAHPALILLLAVILATQVISTVLDLSYYGILKEQVADKDLRNSISGEFWKNVGIASAVGQFIAAPILLRFLPMRLIHLAIPAVHVAMCAYFLQSPTLFSAGLAYLVFKTLDYSLFRAAKETLYIPYSFEVRYRAKEIIDVFGSRFGKGGTSVAVILMQNLGAVVSYAAFAITAIASAAVWLVLIVPVTREEPEKSEERRA
ncbi:MAG: hypothetical protein HY291_01595 [Planctomycetes bacterium]|nr:hypothetical protein [Planctomycetota bacterium]